MKQNDRDHKQVSACAGAARPSARIKQQAYVAGRRHVLPLAIAGALSLGVQTDAEAQVFPPVINLGNLSQGEGFRLDGAAADDYSGRSVTSAGDVNGDGIDDLIVGARNADPNGISGAGSSYVVFGKDTATDGDFAQTVNLGGLDGSDGFRLDGVAAYDGSGRPVAGAGDINGDGFSDLIVGAFSADPNGNDYAGSSYVVFGKGTPFAASIALSSLDGSNGFRLDGAAADDEFGYSVAPAGDINGDGIDDLVAGAFRADPDGTNVAGSSYVVFGKTTSFAASLSVSSLDGGNGFRIDGAAAGDYSGYSVAVAGDINGDGIDDLTIGAPGADPGTTYSGGSAYVVFGTTTPFAATLELVNLDGSNGFRLDAEASNDLAGTSVAGAGDVNGDGINDLIIGAPNAAPNDIEEAGSSYVLFGKDTATQGQFPAALALSELNGSNGFRLDGDLGDNAGTAVARAGDINGDGLGDMIIGAVDASPNGNIFAGSSFVVFGRSESFPAVLELTSLNGSDGFRLDGAAALDFSGEAVSAAGDVNSDGVDDVIVGAFFADPNGNNNAGSSYVVFGRGGDLVFVDGFEAL